MNVSSLNLDITPSLGHFSPERQDAWSRAGAHRDQHRLLARQENTGFTRRFRLAKLAYARKEHLHRYGLVQLTERWLFEFEHSKEE